jgi:hypothetical protein
MEHFASDVNFGLVSRRRAGTYVSYQTADEIASSQYRHACHDRTGIADRLSLLSVGPVRSTSVSVYRSRGNGAFPIANSTEPAHFADIDGKRGPPWRS